LKTVSRFRTVIGQPELPLDLIEMALIVQPFDDIFSSGTVLGSESVGLSVSTRIIVEGEDVSDNGQMIYSGNVVC
jgi:hypothetical protein